MAENKNAQDEKNVKVEKQVQEDSRRSDAGTDQPVPDSARTNGELDGRARETVAEPEERSFNERTAVRQPFILEDGTQDNGAKDPRSPEVDGAKGQSTREGNNTVREDTRKAIEDGKLPASDQPEGTLPGEEREEDKVKNPVK